MGYEISQADPVAMQQAHETFSITWSAAVEAHGRIEREETTLMQVWKGQSANTFNSAVTTWLEKFQLVINDLDAICVALQDTKNDYAVGEGTTMDVSSGLATTTSGAAVPNVL